MTGIRVAPEQVRAFCTEALAAAGVPAQDAAVVAANLVEAELRGLSSHGVSRLSIYIDSLLKGDYNPRPDIKILQEHNSTMLIDGDFAMGAISGTRAMSLCLEKAQQAGASFAAVCKGTHFGIAGFYSMMALERNMIGIAMCNSIRLMSVYGGISRMLGTNPLSIAVPAGIRYPLVFDAATSQVAVGKIMVAELEGQKIPEGWAIDQCGRPTTDPKEAMAGAALPFGGYKGSGLAIMVNVFSAMLSGAFLSARAGEAQAELIKEDEIAFFFGAIDVASFQDVDTFKQGIDAMIEELKSSPKAAGAEEIYMPGELEYLRKESNTRHGIEIGAGVLRELQDIKNKLTLTNNPDQW
ncbi:MAG: Ldh family oxidoreductase [Thermacetogeniaceae bacterium]